MIIARSVCAGIFQWLSKVQIDAIGCYQVIVTDPDFDDKGSCCAGGGIEWLEGRLSKIGADARILVLSFRTPLDIAREVRKASARVAALLYKRGFYLRIPCEEGAVKDRIAHIAMCPGCEYCIEYSFQSVLTVDRNRKGSRPRPIIWIFDDYNTYLAGTQGFFWPLSTVINEELASYFGVTSKDQFLHCLDIHCGLLNALGDDFDVRAPPLWIDTKKGPSYSQATASLPLSEIDCIRKGIAAFIVDLELKPPFRPGVEGAGGESDDWKRLGRNSIHLLSRRYPEIPCYVHTGLRNLEVVQEALAHGAAWCFDKARTHHAFIKSDSANNGLGEWLDSRHLRRQLGNTVIVRYGAFEETPYPDQLVVDPESQVGRELQERLRLSNPLNKSLRGRDIERLVSTVFPNASKVMPIKVFSSGRSKAQATFLLRPDEGGRGRCATRLLKVAPWSVIQKEFHAYQAVIRPRMNNHVADIVQEPVVAWPVGGGKSVEEESNGILVYTLAGFPENHEALHSLGTLAGDPMNRDDGGALLAQRIGRTLREVLQPLYRSTETSGGKLSKATWPLWKWLGHTLPPVLTGDLIPNSMLNIEGCPGSSKIIGARSKLGDKHDVAVLLAALELEHMCIERSKVNGVRTVWFVDFPLSELEWGTSGSGELTIVHPDLGMRMRFRAKNTDVGTAFGGMWLRPGVPATVVVNLDPSNHAIDVLRDKVEDAVQQVNHGTRESVRAKFLGMTKNNGDSDVDPFDLLDVFANGGPSPITGSFCIEAHKGPIHGDLNLENILFAGDEEVGWLIDFEYSQTEGMVAWDLAKLEVELWNWHIFHCLRNLSTLFEEQDEGIMFLLQSTLAACDDLSDPHGKIEARLRQDSVLASVSAEQLMPLKTFVSCVTEIRRFAFETLELSEEELRWAVGTFFAVSTKFAPDNEPWRVVCGYLASIWHLRFVVPCSKTDWQETLEIVAKRQSTMSVVHEVDGILASVARHGQSDDIEIGALVKRVIEVVAPRKRRIAWGAECEVWDVASTGCVGNIMPIIGHLWLRAKCEKEKEVGKKVFAPKLSSKGKSGGTIDILECADATFLSDSRAIIDACRNHGGVLCTGNRLVPVDKQLMMRRKRTNTMKNAAWVYASVLSKKIALGCTHAVIDVKVGQDSKMLAPWMGAEGRSLLGNAGERLVVDEWLPIFQRYLQSMELDVEIKDEYILEKCSEGLAPLSEVRWFLTNANMPQCRAVGRELILLHIDQLFSGKREEKLFQHDNPYKRLYCDRLPRICGLENTNLEQLQEQWNKFKSGLREMSSFAAFQCFEEDEKYGYFAAEKFEEELQVGEYGQDLAAITVGLVPYLPGTEYEIEVRRINAYALDRMFEWLCGDNPYDPEVGIWLHKLPGERVRPRQDPFISVFYHPSLQRKQEVIGQVRRMMREDVGLKEEE